MGPLASEQHSPLPVAQPEDPGQLGGQPQLSSQARSAHIAVFMLTAYLTSPASLETSGSFPRSPGGWPHLTEKGCTYALDVSRQGLGQGGSCPPGNPSLFSQSPSCYVKRPTEERRVLSGARACLAVPVRVCWCLCVAGAGLVSTALWGKEWPADSCCLQVCRVWGSADLSLHLDGACAAETHQRGGLRNVPCWSQGFLSSGW